MRRRVVCPRSHPASPFARVLSVRFAMARGIFRGIPPGPPCRPYARRLRPHLPPTPGLAPPSRWPRPWLVAPRVGGVFGWLCRPLGRLRRPLPGAPSWDAAGAAEGVFAGRCGLGAASSLRMRLWRRIFASEPVVAPHLRFSLCRGAQARLHTPQRPGLRSCPPTRVAPRPLPGRPLFTLRTLVTLRLRHAAIFPRRGYRPWPGKPSRRTCMSTVPGRDASPRRNPQPAHIP
jgi:hypothetical protein